jgi:choline dehydrogenase-like flavoprotein
MPAEALPQFKSVSGDGVFNLLTRSGRSPEPLEDALAGDWFLPFIGQGTGGSSSLYGMVLERRLPHDFRDRPIGYDDLAPWYDKAESLFEVRGSPDPLRADDSQSLRQPAPLSPANDALFDRLRRRGLNPYRLHLASRRQHRARGHA